MEFSPFDIERKAFGSSFLGYTKNQVRAYLEQLAQSYSELLSRNERLEEELKECKIRLGEYKEREKLLRNTLVTAQQAAEQIKRNAEKEAQVIVAEAELKAERILNRTQQRLAQIHEDIIELKRQRTQLEVRLRSTIESHLKMLEIGKKESLEREEIEEKVKFLRQP